jgi:hypothetical protein
MRADSGDHAILRLGEHPARLVAIHAQISQSTVEGGTGNCVESHCIGSTYLEIVHRVGRVNLMACTAVLARRIRVTGSDFVGRQASVDTQGKGVARVATGATGARSTHVGFTRGMN